LKKLKKNVLLTQSWDSICGTLYLEQRTGGGIRCLVVTVKIMVSKTESEKFG